MVKYKITVDKEACIGCGTCVALCDENFEMGDDGKAKVKKPLLDKPGCSENAKESCPVSCISITKV